MATGGKTNRQLWGLCENLKRRAVVFILDGCRPDYLTRTKTKTISRMMSQGVVVDDCRTVFPSLTAPAHTTLTTGLYPKSHGVTSGVSIDPDSRRPREDWMTSYAGKSVAELLKNQGGVTGSVEEFTLFMRGADVYVNVPTHSIGDVARFARTVIETKRPQVLYVVFFAVDDAGHLNGPGSREVDRTIKEVDDAIGQLIESIERSNRSDEALYVLTSDHGMVSVSRDLSRSLSAAIVGAVKNVPFRLWGRFAQFFPQSASQQRGAVQSVARVRGVDAILEDTELKALNMGDEASQGVIVPLDLGYFCFPKGTPRLRGNHGGLGEDETKVPLIFYGRSVCDARLPFAETVDLAPTVAAHLGLRKAAFDGSSLLELLHDPDMRGDEERGRLAQLGLLYVKRVECVRALSELKKRYANGGLTARELRADASRMRKELLNLNSRSVAIRRFTHTTG